MLLNKTMGWKYAGSETTCKTDDETRSETYSKMFDETCKRYK
jgi:hypothetical protein